MQRLEVLWRERFGSKGGVSSLRSERHMKLSSTPSQQFSRLQIAPDTFDRSRRRLFSAQNEPGRSRRRGFAGCRLQYAIEIGADRAEGKFPGVSLIRHKGLEHTQAHRWLLVLPVLQCTGDGRDVRERSPLGEE